MPKRRPEGPEPSLRGLGRDLRAEPSAGKAQGWTTLAMLRAQSLKAWESGELLRELLAPGGLNTGGLYPRRRTLKRPTAATLRTDYAAAHAWASELFAAAGPFSLETADVGRTTIGSNRLPAAAVFAAVEDEISFVGKTRDAARFRDLADGLAALDPALTRWALQTSAAAAEPGCSGADGRAGGPLAPRQSSAGHLRPAAEHARGPHEIPGDEPAGHR